MTVGELIAAMESYPEDMRVILHVEDKTFDDAQIVEAIPIITDKYDDISSGSHEECPPEEATETALLIYGE